LWHPVRITKFRHGRILMIWATSTVLLNALAQILLKSAANQTRMVDWGLSLIWQLPTALVLYAVSVATWVMALRVLPLSVAYPFMALAFILVPIAAVTVFNENLNILQWGFLVLLSASIVGFALSSEISDL